MHFVCPFHWQWREEITSIGTKPLISEDAIEISIPFKVRQVAYFLLSGLLSGLGLKQGQIKNWKIAVVNQVMFMFQSIERQ